MTTTRPTNPDRLEQWIGALLRTGGILSAFVLLVGGGVYLVRHGGERVPDRREFHKQPEKYSSPVAILRAAREGQGRALVQLGLLLLIATPVARVALSLLVFLRRRDVTYALLTLVVLAVLLLGLFGGPAGH